MFNASIPFKKAIQNLNTYSTIFENKTKKKFIKKTEKQINMFN